MQFLSKYCSPFLLFILFFGGYLSNSIYAQTTYTTSQPGEWSNPTTWVSGIVPPEPIPAGDVVNINHWINTFSTTQITNNGTVNVNDAPANPVLELRGTAHFINNGDFNGYSRTFGAALYVRPGASFTNNSHFFIQHPATNNTPVRLTGGSFLNSSSGTMDLDRCLFTIENGSSLFTNEGLLTVGESTQFNILFFTSTNTVVSNSGTIDVDGQLFWREGVYENLPSGVINLNGNRFGQFTLESTLNNSGVINVISDVNAQRTIDLYSDAVLNSATGTINASSGFIRGNGTLIKPTLTNNAILIPFSVDATSDHVLNITGDYDGEGEFRVFPRDPGSSPTGNLVVTGTADIAEQTLQAAFASGVNNLAVGTSIRIITAAGGVTGTFSSESLPFHSASNLEWRVEYGADFVNLVVVDINQSADSDGDGIEDDVDNCPTIANADQTDTDGDGDGDLCDDDDDGDGILDVNDSCPLIANADQTDTDGDGAGDACDDDDDGDGILDVDDNCPLTANADQTDTDSDGSGDACDDDDDGDGILDVNDNCPLTANPDQADLDGDNIGDVCDPDPIVESITIPLDPVSVGSSVDVSGTFSDPDDGDAHTASWDWGDGSSSAGAVDQGANSVSGSHNYTVPGVYTVNLTITDGDGNTGSGSAQSYIVVYDPDGGFVTGGGWIDSPEGAYTPDPSVSGKANFGFVSKYKKGASVPTGNTTFHLNAAGFKFKSTSYEWLVIAGPNAKYKGEGEINGAGTYQFMLTGTDGDVNGGGGVDKFRIKIWGAGGVIYDNKMGSDDEGYDTQAIGGGSIVIHSGGNGGRQNRFGRTSDIGDLQLSVFPNPASGNQRMQFQLPSSEHVRIEVINMQGQVLYSHEGNYEAGQHELEWNGISNKGEKVASGVYFVRVLAKSQQVSAQIIRK